MDVVYVLGSGSKWNDHELKYSLRSVFRHLKNFRRVAVAGDLPRCMLPAGVFFLPMRDTTSNKQVNVQEKLRKLCEVPQIGEDILLMNDDFFFLRDVDANSIPLYRQGTIAEHLEWRSEVKSTYSRALEITNAVLRDGGFPTLDFEVHVPIPLNKEKLRGALQEIAPGALLRSTYANRNREPGVLLSDCKLDSPLTYEEIERRTAERDFFSLGDGGINTDMKKFLEKRYPA